MVDEIIKSAFYVDRELPEQVPAISIQNKVIATGGNFITINGAPKNFKSTIMQFFIASALTNNSIFNIQLNSISTDQIVIIDTEQSIYDFHRQQKKLKNLLGTNILPENLSSYLFRKFDPDVIVKSIEVIINEKKPKYLFIDNLTELVMNPNDILETKNIIQKLKKWTDESGTVIICLLHIARTSGQVLGHLGSYADRGAQTTMKVSFDEDTNIVKLEAGYMRSDIKFKPIHIAYNQDQHIWESVDIEMEKPKKRERFNVETFTPLEHFERLQAIFLNTNDTYFYNDLIINLSQVYGIGQTTTKQQVLPFLIKHSYIIKLDKNYKFNHLKKTT